MEYPSNSHKSKAEQERSTERRKQQRVTSGRVVKRKKPISRRLTETLTSEDSYSVGQYILFDVIVPAAKAMITDAVSQGAERLLFGDSRRPTSGPRRGNYTPYNRAGTGRPYETAGPRLSSGGRELGRRSRASHNFDEIILDSRGEAEEVLDRLSDLIQNYDVATVSDLYDLVGITGSFTDDRWGWTDLRGAGVRRVREGYLLDLPKTAPID